MSIRDVFDLTDKSSCEGGEPFGVELLNDVQSLFKCTSECLGYRIRADSALSREETNSFDKAFMASENIIQSQVIGAVLQTASQGSFDDSLDFSEGLLRNYLRTTPSWGSYS